MIAALFCTIGALHFAVPEPFVRMMPPQLPAPLALVYASGVFEIVGGLGLLVPRTRAAAAIGLVALLVAVFPANIHMALDPTLFPELPVVLLWLRLPLQFVFIALVWWARGSAASRNPPA